MNNSPTNTYKVVSNYRFSMSSMLGKGSYGTVYYGTHIKTNQPVAIKSIDRKLIVKDVKSQIDLETNIMKQLNHPNIIQLIDVVDTQHNKYIITEYCSGKDLREILKNKKYKLILKIRFLPEAEAIEVLKDIMRGLQEMMKHNIIHRDLKPANIIKHNSTYKIGDFGFSRNFEQLQMMESLVGTPLYMAPQILLKYSYTNKCDIWSLGMLYYEILVGQTPWIAHSIQELLQNIQQQPLSYPQNRQISQLSKDFISACLKVDEKKRIDWNQLFAHPLLRPPTPKPIVYIKQARERCTSTYQEAKNKVDITQPVKTNAVIDEGQSNNSSQSTFHNSSQQKIDKLKRPETQRPQGSKPQEYYIPQPKLRPQYRDGMRRTRSQLENLQTMNKITTDIDQPKQLMVKNQNFKQNIKSLYHECSIDKLLKFRHGSQANNQVNDIQSLHSILRIIEQTLVNSKKDYKVLLKLVQDHLALLLKQQLKPTQLNETLKAVQDILKTKPYELDQPLFCVYISLYNQILKNMIDNNENKLWCVPKELQLDIETILNIKYRTNKIPKPDTKPQ